MSMIIWQVVLTVILLFLLVENIITLGSIESEKKSNREIIHILDSKTDKVDEYVASLKKLEEEHEKRAAKIVENARKRVEEIFGE